MGEFVEAMAARSAEAGPVLEAVVAYAAGYGVDSAIVSGESEDLDSVEVVVWQPSGEWTVLTCEFHEEAGVAPLAMELSHRLSTIASCVTVYDGDFWSHVLFDQGAESDRFVSVPDYFEEDPGSVSQLRRRWAGNATAITAAIGCPVDQVAPYLVHLSDEDIDGGADRALSDDEFTLDDAWVFTDFWRRLGIRYPDPPDRAHAGIEFTPGWEQRLPSGDEWSL